MGSNKKNMNVTLIALGVIVALIAILLSLEPSALNPESLGQWAGRIDKAAVSEASTITIQKFTRFLGQISSGSL